MKTIEEQKNILVKDIQYEMEILNKRYIRSMKAFNRAQEIMDEVMPAMKKLHMPDYKSIHVIVPEEFNRATISLNMNTDEKFKFYKRSYLVTNWWKTNSRRVGKRIDKMINTIKEICSDENIGVGINQFSLVLKGESDHRSILVDIHFDIPEE